MLQFFATNPLARLALLALIFAITMFVAMALIGFFTRRATLRADLREIEASGSLVAHHGRLGKANETAWTRLADRIEKTGLSLGDTQGDALRAKLVAAGYDSPAAPRIYTLIRLVLVFVLPISYYLLVVAKNPGITFFRGTGMVMLLALGGLYIPALFVTARADRRREEVMHGFPDCLDLLLVCVEAGLALEAALDRVGREMVNTHPLVSRLLSTATLQLRAGAPRELALRRMGEESGVDEVRNFATLLIQSDKLGTSIATTLRVYAAEMREKRQLRAEEKAHRLPVLISIPLVACMLPTMIGVLMLPGVVRIVRQLIPALGG